MARAPEEIKESLAERLRSRIQREGPITFREWMQSALYDERDGYYCRPDLVRQGRSGDYRTAPETSPLFALTLASYFSKLFADLFSKLGSPPVWTIFEAGAGNGEFARGLLNAFRSEYPDVFSATRYVIDEVSPATRLRASERLAEFTDRVSFERLAEIKSQAAGGIVFSNELVDAFPVHRVSMQSGKLIELCVGLRGEDFVWIESEPKPEVSAYCERVRLQLAEGQIAEINLEAEMFMPMAARLMEHGFVVTIDYGAERPDLLGSPDRFAGTLRGFQRHQLVADVLARPGEQDLTTTIDWTQLKDAGRRAGLRTIRFERLDEFLISEGLLEILSRQVTRSAGEEADAVRASVSARELILPTGLAAAFQVLVQEKDS
jgi:SAM-dependent MidA family methyltransferase